MKLSIKELSFFYPGNADKELILQDVNWQINHPGIISIEGENGSGKTTLMKLLSSLLELKEGSIMLDEKKVGSDAYKKSMGYIMDSPILFDDLTGTEHMEVFCELWEMAPAERELYQANVYEYAEKLNLSKYLCNKVRTYSLGTKYKLFYILTVSRKPTLLLLDEPFNALDFRSQEIAKEILSECAKNAIVILSSHQKELIEKLSQKRFVKKKKRIEEVRQ